MLIALFYFASVATQWIHPISTELPLQARSCLSQTQLRLPKGSRFSIPAGAPSPHQIGGVSDLVESTDTQSNALYIHSFAPEVAIDWVHNPSYHPLDDLCDTLTRKHPEYTPAIAHYLRETFLAFHEKHKGNPSVKYFQICHQRGALDVSDALESLPHEVRQRVIVLAISPIKVVPAALCYQAYNYRSWKDIIPTGTLLHAMSLLSSNTEEEAARAQQQLLEMQPLTAHPLASGYDRDFQSLTFAEKIDFHIQQYLQNNGKYP
jgi:hypothetical protein